MLWLLALGFLVKLYVKNGMQIEVNTTGEKKLFFLPIKQRFVSKPAIGLGLTSLYLFGLFSFFS